MWKYVAVLAGLMLAVSSPARAAEPETAAKKNFDKVLAAIQAGDRDAAVANATDAVKEAVTAEVMEGLSKQLGARLKKGFEAKYLCQLKQRGIQVYLWKLAFKDGGDDAVFRLAMKDGKIEGFFIQ